MDVSTKRWGLRFADRAVEQDYVQWRLQHIRTFTKWAMVAGGIASAGALVVVAYGAVPSAGALELGLIAAMVACHLLGAWLTTRDELVKLILPFSALDNVLGGALAIAVSMPLDDFAVTATCLTMAAYFGMTMFRMRPLMAFLAVGSYMAYAEVYVIAEYLADDMTKSELLIGIFFPTAALLTGFVLCLGIERATRRTYTDHRIIEEQRELLFYEHSNMARFLSPELMATIQRRGIEETLSPEILPLTVVCTDLRGFTSFTHYHGAEAMAAVLHDYYAAIIETTRLFGAMVKDFAGDGALILIGAPLPRADHARIGVDLARGIIASVSTITGAYGTPEAPLGIGIGVASGDCAVGAIGSLSRLEYTAVGTPVNLASRLCAVAQDGEIVLAESTVRLVGQAPAWRAAAVHVKGFRDPIEVAIELPRIALAD
ncbi:MAG TPA: adenylate/guanylate cyclase domain-containing protein [Nocardioidaceae bacterium]|nr:adenylate/guanylate cyclase domain-containing protein [Nocardioidaceae bacterium]